MNPIQRYLNGERAAARLVAAKGALALEMSGGGDTRLGVGMGLSIQASVTPAFDVFAEPRGALCLACLRGSA